MTNKIIAYRYKPIKALQIVGIIGSVFFILVAFGILIHEPFGLETTTSIIAISLFGIFLIAISFSLLKPGKKKQMPYNSFDLKLYRRYNSIWFIILRGISIALAIILIVLMTDIRHKGREIIEKDWYVYAISFFSITIIAGLIQLIKIQHILKTGEPVYDLYEQAKNENHENIK